LEAFEMLDAAAERPLAGVANGDDRAMITPKVKARVALRDTRGSYFCYNIIENGGRSVS
jgi:hypothetical protein